jgi:hypothetical protein
MRSRTLASVVAVVAALGAVAATKPLCAQQSFSILSPQRQKAETAILSALDEVVELNFVEAPLNDVVSYFADKAEVPIRMELKKLEEASVSADTPVTFLSKTLPLNDALSLILEPLELDWIIKKGVVTITTREEASQFLTTQVYPVRDLIKKGQSPWGEELTTVITTDIDTSSWDRAGGPGRIAVAPSLGVVVVSQTREVHEKIAGLLAALRAVREQRDE